MTELDTLDRAIIRELEQDGRTPFREIARSLSVSEATIRARYHRLTDRGVLRVVAFADPAARANSRLALLFVRVTPERHDAVVKGLAAREEVSYVSTILGRRDVFAQVLVTDDAALWTFLQTVVRTMDGVLESDLTLEVKVHKLWFDATPAI